VLERRRWRRRRRRRVNTEFGVIKTY